MDEWKVDMLLWLVIPMNPGLPDIGMIVMIIIYDCYVRYDSRIVIVMYESVWLTYTTVVSYDMWSG